MRPIGVGRRSRLLAGSDTGDEILARAMALIETAEMNALDTRAHLADLLGRIHGPQARRLDELPPGTGRPTTPRTGPPPEPRAQPAGTLDAEKAHDHRRCRAERRPMRRTRLSFTTPTPR